MKILGSNRWKRRPGGGELSYYTTRDQKRSLTPTGPHGVSFEAAARQFHISYMIGNDQPRYQPMERIVSAGMATGYRFRVTSATISGSHLQLTVTNDGVAPIYRDAWFSAGTKRSATSLRGLLPGERRKCLIKGVDDRDVQRISIRCEAILPTQTIQFDADLK